MLKVSLYNLTRNKSRTLLSMLGVIIGVTAIMGLVSVVDGVFLEVQTAISQVQGVRVSSLSQGDPIFSQMDESWGEKIERIQGVKVAIPTLMGQINTIDGESIQYGPRVIGSDLEKQAIAGFESVEGEIIEGRNLESGDSGVVLIGKKLKEDFRKFVGNNIKVNGEKYRVAGVLETGSDFLDYIVVMPIDDARDLLSFPEDKVSLFNVILNNVDDDKKVVREINFRYGDEIEAFTTTDFSEQIGGVIGNFRLLVFVVAGISAIVAGIGIINTMLMSVLERFKEIGALKAVGWTNLDIMKMVIYESLFIGLIGGVLGLGLGALTTVAIEVYADLPTAITPMLLMQAFGFALVISVLAGIYPAYIASKMDPIDALQTE